MRALPRKPATPLGDRLYELRIQADLTQEMVEYRTEVHFTSWSKYERGQVLPGEDALLKFAVALDLSTETYEELLRLRAETPRCDCVRPEGEVGPRAWKHRPSCRYSRVKLATTEVVDEHNGVPATRYTRNPRKG